MFDAVQALIGMSRAPYGARGLKLYVPMNDWPAALRRAPYGARGLK